MELVIAGEEGNENAIEQVVEQGCAARAGVTPFSLNDEGAADDVYVRQGAAAALEELSGDGFGYDPRATAEANLEAVGKFRAWGAAKYGKAWED